MTSLLFVLSLVLLSSCTYSVNLVHSHGTATDVIDDGDTATPDISPTVTVPLSPGTTVGIEQ